MSNDSLHILVADDEAPARRKVTQFLQKYSTTFTVEEATDGLSTIEKIKNYSPDLVLLDIQMPHYTGMEVVREIGVSLMPSVIFLTAYQEYAIQAFEVQAIDYLLKPFDFERFRQALDRAIERMQQQQQPSAAALQKLTNAFPSPTSYKNHLWVHQNGRYLPLTLLEVAFFKAEDNYINCSHQGKIHLIRETLQHLETSLNPQYFVRTHRSYLVNLRFIKEVFPKSHGDCIIRLSSGAEVPLSRRYRNRVLG